MVSVERGLKVRRSEVEAVAEVVQPLPVSPQTPALFSCKRPPKCLLFQEAAPGSPSGSWIPLCLCAGEPEALEISVLQGAALTQCLTGVVAQIPQPPLS